MFALWAGAVYLYKNKKNPWVVAVCLGLFIKTIESKSTDIGTTV